MHEGAIGLVLTGLMILIFLGSMRATAAVFLSIPLSALAAFFALDLGNSTVNSMVLGGLALAFSRLIDNSVVVLENIYRHLEMGEPPEVAAERGGKEVALPVLAATLATVIVFFPGHVSLWRQPLSLWRAGAGGGSLPFCLLFRGHDGRAAVLREVDQKARSRRGTRNGRDRAAARKSWGARFNVWFNHKFTKMLDRYEGVLNITLLRPLATVLGITGIFLLSLALYPLVGQAYFPRTDPGQFVINVKAPSGTRLELTDKLVGQVEDVVRAVVPKRDLKIIVSNIGITPGFSSILTPNSAPHTAFVQVGLNDDHQLSSFAYMNLVRARLQKELPEVSAYFQTGGLVDAIFNQGMPAPLDIQVSGMDMPADHAVATKIAQQVRALPGVSDVLVPQDVDYPALKIDIDRERASELGLCRPGSRGQPHHRPDLQRHDRAELLD